MKLEIHQNSSLLLKKITIKNILRKCPKPFGNKGFLWYNRERRL